MPMPTQNAAQKKKQKEEEMKMKIAKEIQKRIK